ncbi:MAG: dihydroorotate dehydrogenase [Actinomycetota bacterium]|nr:dihydroorotate dehydrogenase [Actinomycetota bacterium]
MSPRWGWSRRERGAAPTGDVDLTTAVGSVTLPNPVLAASGTAGHADELGAYVALDRLGAVVVKSLASEPWPGNPAPRVRETHGGMLNSVGLQGPGIEAWLGRDLGRLLASGARVVVSVWGRTVADFESVARRLADGLPAATGPGAVVAIEVNVSCPNVEDRRRMFAHSPTATAEAVAAVGAGCPMLPRWAKLSPNVADLVEVAGAAYGAGAEGVTLVNTLLGLAVDVEHRRIALGSGPAGGGLSGPAVLPVAVRSVFDVRAAYPDGGIVGVGGVSDVADALQLVMAGADAVAVGTATLRDPRATERLVDGLARWCRAEGVRSLDELRGVVHG